MTRSEEDVMSAGKAATSGAPAAPSRGPASAGAKLLVPEPWLEREAPYPYPESLLRRSFPACSPLPVSTSTATRFQRPRRRCLALDRKKRARETRARVGHQKTGGIGTIGTPATRLAKKGHLSAKRRRRLSPLGFGKFGGMRRLWGEGTGKRLCAALPNASPEVRPGPATAAAAAGETAVHGSDYGGVLM